MTVTKRGKNNISPDRVCCGVAEMKDISGTPSVFENDVRSQVPVGYLYLPYQLPTQGPATYARLAKRHVLPFKKM